MGVYKLKSLLAMLCQDLWVLTPHPLCLQFLLHFWVLYIFNFLEKVLGPGLQGLYVATPVRKEIYRHIPSAGRKEIYRHIPL